MTKTSPGNMTVKQAAKELGVSVKTVCAYVREMRLESTVVDGNIMIPAEAVARRKATVGKIRKSGPVRIDFDPDTIYRMAKRNCTVESMAAILGVSMDTIYERLRNDDEIAMAFQKGHHERRDTLKQFAWEQATSGKPGTQAILIFLLKAECGYVEKQIVENIGDDQAQQRFREAMEEQFDTIRALIEDSTPIENDPDDNQESICPIEAG